SNWSFEQGSHRFLATISSCKASASANCIRPTQRALRESVAAEACTDPLMTDKRLFKVIMSLSYQFEITPLFLSGQMPTVLRIGSFRFHSCQKYSRRIQFWIG